MLDRKQFQIESGGLVQGVTKLITALSTLVTQNFVDPPYLGGVRFVKNGFKQIKMQNTTFFSHFSYKIYQSLVDPFSNKKSLIQWLLVSSL